MTEHPKVEEGQDAVLSSLRCHLSTKLEDICEAEGRRAEGKETQARSTERHRWGWWKEERNVLRCGVADSGSIRNGDNRGR